MKIEVRNNINFFVTEGNGGWRHGNLWRHYWQLSVLGHRLSTRISVYTDIIPNLTQHDTLAKLLNSPMIFGISGTVGRACPEEYNLCYQSSCIVYLQCPLTIFGWGKMLPCLTILFRTISWPTDLVITIPIHYSDVITGAMASQITRFTIVYSTIYTCADQRKHQSFASLAFVREIHHTNGQ